MPINRKLINLFPVPLSLLAAVILCTIQNSIVNGSPVSSIGAQSRIKTGPPQSEVESQNTASVLPLQRSHPSQIAVLPSILPSVVEGLKQLSSQQPESRLQIGLNRALDSALIVNAEASASEQWTELPSGGRVLSLQIASVGALGLRVHLQNVSLPPGAQLIMYDPANPYASAIPIPVTSPGSESDLWSPTLFAEQAVIECQLSPNTDSAEVACTINEVSHIYQAPVQPSFLKEGTCEKDASCYAAYAQPAAGVAMISYVQGGNTYLCTGCLLATTDPRTAAEYFLTAHHCVENQSLASTVEFYWFFQTPSCNAQPPAITSVPKTTGGAELLFTGTDSDFSLLRLRRAAPSGVTYLGWSVSPPTSTETLACIHHPDGAYKRISLGKLFSSDADFWAVRWSTGVTEPGSSGSPLLNGNRQVIGQLNGGFAGPGSSCGNPSAPDQYGKFALAYDSIKRWIDPGTSTGGSPPLAAGTYSGLFSNRASGIAQQSAGSFTLTTSSKGRFSGKIQLGSARFSFTGALDSAGNGSASITRRGLSALTVQFQIDVSQGGEHVNGTINASDWTATMSGDRAVFDGRSNSSPQAGRYTLIIPRTISGPGGDSYGMITVDNSGRLSLSGGLADGTKLSQSTRVSKEGRWPLYVPLYGGQGSLFSWVTLNPDGPSGQGSWTKPALLKAKYYKSGFAITPALSGSRYNRPGIGSPILSFTDGNIILSGGNLSGSINNGISLSASGRVTSQSNDRLRLTFSLSTGAFSGSVLDPNTKRSISFHGVVVQNQNFASGYFTANAESGEVMVKP